jgi:hypothetical protein
MSKFAEYQGAPHVLDAFIAIYSKVLQIIHFGDLNSRYFITFSRSVVLFKALFSVLPRLIHLNVRRYVLCEALENIQGFTAPCIQSKRSRQVFSFVPTITASNLASGYLRIQKDSISQQTYGRKISNSPPSIFKFSRPTDLVFVFRGLRPF